MKNPCNSVPKRCATLWLLLITLFAHAQNSPIGRSNGSGGAALVIGISQYKEVTPLQFADKDALAFAEFLKTQQVPEDNIKLFLNEEATRFNIVDELYTTSQKLKKGDKFFFYFGGHGDLEAKIGYENSLLLLYNSFKKSYFQGNEYLQLSELKTWFGALTQKGVEVVFIADACHSGGLIGGKEGNTKTQKALQESWDGITKILSSKADEFSLEGKQWGGGRGIFSYHLVNGLTGRADANKDQKVSLAELGSYLTTNVLREANPNIQTPVVMGNSKQLLSKVSKEGLAKLADYEKRNFPIITEVNLKGGGESDALLISKLDTTLVSTYKLFTKAIKEKRLNTFDDSTNYALLHYRKLVARKIPDNLVQLMKRNLGAALQERELDLLKEPREKGRGYVVRVEKLLVPAIANLGEAMKLFGPSHYFYNFLQARKWVLEGSLQSSIPRTESKEAQLRIIREDKLREKASLLKALQLEPNMISTYGLLATFYKGQHQPDSALYYQEKVVALLPNQAYPYLTLGGAYSTIKYTDANNKPVPHPKAIQYLEKVIELEPTMVQPYSMLGELYMIGKIYHGETPTSYHDYPKAIYYYEKALSFHEIPEQELRTIDFKNPSSNEKQQNFGLQNKYYAILCFLYKATGDIPKSEEYFNKLIQKVAIVSSVSAYRNAVFDMYSLCYYDKNNSEMYLKQALDILQRALKRADEDLKVASAKDKLTLSLEYKNLLIAIGSTQRAIKNYAEAEKMLQQALEYPIADTQVKLKLVTMSYLGDHDRFITVAFGIQKAGTIYKYSLDANVELFFLNLEQDKPDEAFAWLEKAFQNAVAESGNYLSEKEFEDDISKIYTKLDQARFKALKAKYFPPTEKK